MFIQLVLAASFLFPIPLTAIIYYLNVAQDKYATKTEAFDALWQSVIGFGMLLLLPCILGIIAALLFFMERDNDTFKNLRTIPVTSTQMVLAKCFVLLVLSVIFCVSSTVATMLCGFVFWGVSDILFKLLFSILYGLLIAISALPLVLLIVFFSKSYIFSIMLCVFYSVFNLLSSFSMTALPKVLVHILPTPSIMMWGTEQEEYLRIADLAGEKLFASQQFEENTRKGWLGAGSKYPLAGFSHGVAGIAYSLVKLWSYTQKEKYLQAVVASIRFENSLYDDKIGNWKDEREYNGHKSSEQNIYMTAWCHGAAGILLSRCKIMQFDIDKELQDELNKDIKTALATTLKYGFGENDCLCHGNLGNTEILMEYGRMFNDIKTLDLCGEIREAACKRILGANYDSGRSYLYGYQIPGFMTGLSGMGYSLLRDINKELPCILSLEI